MTENETNQIAFEIVALSGEARTYLLEAFNLLVKKDYDTIANKIKQATELLTTCHQKQFDMLQKVALKEPVPFSLMMVHGQDHLMTTITMKEILTSLVDYFKQTDQNK